MLRRFSEERWMLVHILFSALVIGWMAAQPRRKVSPLQDSPLPARIFPLPCQGRNDVVLLKFCFRSPSSSAHKLILSYSLHRSDQWSNGPMEGKRMIDECTFPLAYLCRLQIIEAGANIFDGTFLLPHPSSIKVRIMRQVLAKWHCRAHKWKCK